MHYPSIVDNHKSIYCYLNQWLHCTT